MHISPITATLLYQRGISDIEQARLFLYGELKDLSDPFSLTGMAEAVRRIKSAAENHEKVVIYGDYDVDGICSTVIVKECLAALNCQADYYMPDRFSEGYGVNEQAVRHLAAQGYTLMISVDCGITSVNEVRTASLLGMDSIITDHHTPGPQLPPAVAIINPKLEQTETLHNLAGAGVAFILAHALCRENKRDEKVYQWLDLVALATIADIVSLQGQNRIMVREGLKKIQYTVRPGLQALMQETGLRGKPLTSGQVSFILAPRLNSAGRMDNAADSVDLLLATDPARCSELARKLCRLNDERKIIENKVLELALQQIETEVDLDREPLLILTGEGWHHGVLGIVASHLCEKYMRPVVLISWEGDIGRGSGRSAGDLDLYQILSYSRAHLIQFGGHKMAAGLTIGRDQLEAFKKAAVEWTLQNMPQTVKKKVYADMEIDLQDIDEKLCQELELLQPFGEGNPEPSLLIRNCRVCRPVLVGKNNEHIKYRIQQKGLDCIAFNRAEWMQLPLLQCCQDIMCQPVFNDFRGTRTIQLKIRDMKCSYIPDEGNIRKSKASSDFNHIAERTAGALKANHSVLFIYPTCRSIIKHQLAVNNFFNPEIVGRLHGQLGKEERMKISSEFKAGRPKLFLMTETYFRYCCQEGQIPDNIAYVVYIWPEENSTLDDQLKYKHDIAVLPVYSENLFVNRSKDWVPDNKRLLVYANRQKTVQRISNGISRSFIEAGLNDLVGRRSVRRSFADCQTGVLLWDGSSSCLPPAGKISELVLADVPYGFYELTGAYNELSASADLPAVITFERDDMAFNRSYLDRLYPGPETVLAVWKYINELPGTSLRRDIKVLLQDLGDCMETKMTWFDLAPIMHILSDLDLCRVQKKGSIIEIKFINSEIIPSDINRSLYYLEGLAEKISYSRLEKKLIKTLAW